jgi:hypothetical protein
VINQESKKMEKKTGIILKTFFPKKMKMVLLDYDLGKIEGVPSTDSFSCGSMLAYDAQAKGNLYFLHAKNDILFLHHALELCYFCVPFGKHVPEIFFLMVHLYQQLPLPYTYAFKIAFLFKLLVTLGMHPEESRFQDSQYYLLARESIDTIMNKSIHLDTKETLHEWVRACVATHPQIHVFKTMHFLDI